MDSIPPIVLTTDFGLADPYVGVMKGVILGINPWAAIIDLTHSIQPQNIMQAAFVMGASWRYFPPGAIHVAVVDPGVGTRRKAVLLITPRASFLAPDNGVLSDVLAQHLDNPPAGASATVSVPPGCAAYQLAEPSFWRPRVSNTFHGRDIFAPVAAHLSRGEAPAALGPPVAELTYRPSPRPVREGRQVRGEVVYTDHFGNLVTNISESMAIEDGLVRVEIKGRGIDRLSLTYRDANTAGEGHLLALVGSHGYLEIALADGSAARQLPAGTGEVVTLYYG
jgi:S-adenosyl-L-methionine hydrolase (adenosine-forming)